MGEVHNPLLSGFYPDPSICRAGEDYYLATSTFAYVPGVPIFHSRDLMNWNRIGHALEREEQLRLEGAGMSEGIFAPCIRYEDGVYYIISTNISGGGNFYVTAEKPEGPWSDPFWLEEAEGIDPSLFFDNGKCFYVGQRDKRNGKYYGDCEIWLQELDLETHRLKGEVSVLWDGASKHAIWPEGPHLYKRNGFYYLLIAEGGTGYEHSICIARSETLTGKYESCPCNPIFTHRHLGHNARIQNTGHGDLVETPDGKWYIVMLGTRPLEGHAPLGRETFIAEVAWENDWPVINPGKGKLSEIQQISIPVQKSGKQQKPEKDYLFFRFLEKEAYRIEENGNLMLRALPRDFSGPLSPAYIGLRITSHRFGIGTEVTFLPARGEEAGLVYLYDENHYIKCVVTATENDEIFIKAVKVSGGKENVLSCHRTCGEKHGLNLRLAGLKLNGMADGKELFADLDVREFTQEAAGGFVGCTMGVYASAGEGNAKNAGDSAHYALFSSAQKTGI